MAPRTGIVSYIVTSVCHGLYDGVNALRHGRFGPYKVQVRETGSTATASTPKLTVKLASQRELSEDFEVKTTKAKTEEVTIDDMLKNNTRMLDEIFEKLSPYLDTFKMNPNYSIPASEFASLRNFINRCVDKIDITQDNVSLRIRSCENERKKSKAQGLSQELTRAREKLTQIQFETSKCFKENFKKDSHIFRMAIEEASAVNEKVKFEYKIHDDLSDRDRYSPGFPETSRKSHKKAWDIREIYGSKNEDVWYKDNTQRESFEV